MNFISVSQWIESIYQVLLLRWSDNVLLMLCRIPPASSPPRAAALEPQFFMGRSEIVIGLRGVPRAAALRAAGPRCVLGQGRKAGGWLQLWAGQECGVVPHHCRTLRRYNNCPCPILDSSLIYDHKMMVCIFPATKTTKTLFLWMFYCPHHGNISWISMWRLSAANRCTRVLCSLRLSRT